jgi:DNA-directed RNA polymerase specialized sigma24 family protein
MNEDWTLLQRYRDAGDEGAFAELVRRYLNLVWSTCDRITDDGDLARDLAQAVFNDLARKADRISCKVSLTG